uniref:Uncharacterized protein n=1 Tax=Anguilla anguilla TaxID=7936 RepID=A0A0E9QMG1_ANGAN
MASDKQIIRGTHLRSTHPLHKLMWEIRLQTVHEGDSHLPFYYLISLFITSAAGKNENALNVRCSSTSLSLYS